MSTLAAIAVARNPDMRMDTLSYRNQAMNLQVIAPDVATIAALESKLEQTRRFAVVLESQTPGESGTEGRLRIVGANP